MLSQVFGFRWAQKTKSSQDRLTYLNRHMTVYISWIFSSVLTTLTGSRPPKKFSVSKNMASNVSEPRISHVPSLPSLSLPFQTPATQANM